MECSFWYAPSKYYVPVVPTSKTAPARHLRAPDAAAGSPALRVLPGIQRFAAHSTRSQRAGSAASACLVRHFCSAIRHTKHVAGRCRQLLQRWIPQAAVGLRRPGDDGAGSGPQEIEMRSSWSAAPLPSVLWAIWIPWSSTPGLASTQNRSPACAAGSCAASVGNPFLFRDSRLAT